MIYAVLNSSAVKSTGRSQRQEKQLRLRARKKERRSETGLAMEHLPSLPHSLRKIAHWDGLDVSRDLSQSWSPKQTLVTLPRSQPGKAIEGTRLRTRAIQALSWARKKTTGVRSCAVGTGAAAAHRYRTVGSQPEETDGRARRTRMCREGCNVVTQVTSYGGLILVLW